MDIDQLKNLQKQKPPKPQPKPQPNTQDKIIPLPPDDNIPLTPKQIKMINKPNVKYLIQKLGLKPLPSPEYNKARKISERVHHHYQTFLQSNPTPVKPITQHQLRKEWLNSFLLHDQNKEDTMLMKLWIQS
jgi:hypothetical protein